MTIRVYIEAPEHSGKTSVMAIIITALKAVGMNVKYQLIDPQLDEKLNNPEHCKARLNGEDIVLFERQTYS